MTQDVRQWLAEIKHLQQKVVETCQERDEAYAGAANWRKLYEREAQQRRTDATLAAQTIDALKAELIELQRLPQAQDKAPVDVAVMQQQVDQLDGAELKQKLLDLMVECDRLSQALKTEQESHTQTRNSLTIALGDTVDLLTKERAARTHHAESVPVAMNGSAASASLEASKNPSLELPPLNQVQSLV
ncbi:MAG: hypothetical protein SFY66_09855 [Oculatellaceae cyanobacterium bins.114]|nr:hypothetical protein [Oculatellaceae cyanobacterium bins.114]